MADSLFDLAGRVMDLAKKQGVDECCAGVGRASYVSMEWRDGKLENVEESTTRGVMLRMYVDQRYSVHSISDIRPEALAAFVADAVEMTRCLAKDPYRSLPDPALYQGRSEVDLLLGDPSRDQWTPQARIDALKTLEDAARSVPGAERLISVSAGVQDSSHDGVRIQSNGFQGTAQGTSFWVSAESTIHGDGDKRPAGWSSAGSRWLVDLPSPMEVGAFSTRRALDQLGARSIPSQCLPVLVEGRVAGRLAGMLLGDPLSARALQQNLTFLAGQQGKQVGSDKLNVLDQPLVVKGFGSRLFDGEGIASRPLVLFERGVLRNYYVDTYYGRKIDMPPTTGSSSNLEWELGSRGLEEMIASIPRGVLITAFLGGNSNGLSGDFSLGVRGFLIEQGQLAHPLHEMNLGGNQLTLWSKLLEVGDDPYPYSALRCPSMLFDELQLSGS